MSGSFPEEGPIHNASIDGIDALEDERGSTNKGESEGEDTKDELVR